MKRLSLETKLTLSLVALVIALTLGIVLRVLYLIETGYYEALFV